MTITVPSRALQLPLRTSEMAGIFSPDRSRLLTKDDRTIHIWEVETGNRLHTLTGHNGPVSALAWTADQQWVASGGHDDGCIRVWDVGSGECLSVLQCDRIIRSLEFSPSRVQILSGSGDGLVRLWELSSGKLLQQFKGHTDGVYHAVFDTSLTRILSGGRDRTVRLWEMTTGRCLKVMSGSGYHIQCLAWHADQRRFLSCADDIRLWDAETGDCLRVFKDHRATIRTVAWSHDQRQVLSASHDRSVRIWDSARACCIQVLQGHEDCVVSAVWTLDRRHVLSCDSSGGLRWWAMKATPDSDDHEPYTDE